VIDGGKKGVMKKKKRGGKEVGGGGGITKSQGGCSFCGREGIKKDREKRGKIFGKQMPRGFP